MHMRKERKHRKIPTSCGQSKQQGRRHVCNYPQAVDRASNEEGDVCATDEKWVTCRVQD